MKAILPLLAILLVGCERTTWVERHDPTTDVERKAVAEHAERILSATPKSLNGHDQDWDDAIAQAHRDAARYLCRPTLWEWYDGGLFKPGFGLTGRWKYMDQPPTEPKEAK